MSVFDRPTFDGHEEVIFFHDAEAGLRAIVAIHDSGAFGMSGGGCRMWPYASDEVALDDVLRLSRAMTFKLALAELPAGGAKMAVIADACTDKTPALLEAIGRSVHRLNGRFVVGTDVGTNDEDLAVVARATPYVSRASEGHDTAAATAYGVFLSIRWAARRRLGREHLDGIRVAIQGAGRVGSRLARFLADEGARLIVADVDEAAARALAEQTGAAVASPYEILAADADVFAPCALGDVVDAEVADRLRVKIVAGAANNPLTDEEVGDDLHRRGVLFVPDFVANLGGVIGASPAGAGGDDAAFLKPVERVTRVLEEVAKRAERDATSLQRAAVTIAEERVAARRR